MPEVNSPIDPRAPTPDCTVCLQGPCIGGQDCAHTKHPGFLAGAATTIMPPDYTAQGVNFDGSTYLTGATNTPFTGAIVGGKCLISFWFRFQDTSEGVAQFIFLAAGLVGLTIEKQANNRWIVHGKDASAVACFSAGSLSTFLPNDRWHHLLCARDTGGDPQLRIDGADDLSGMVNAGTNNIAYNAAATMTICGSGLPVIGDVAELWIGYNQYLDISLKENILKFRDPQNRPVDLGANGETPTGARPTAFFSGAVATWHQNKGSGGVTFTVTGALTESSQNP